MGRSRVVAVCAIALLLVAGCAGQDGTPQAGGGYESAAAEPASDDDAAPAWDESTEEADPDAGAAVGLGAKPKPSPTKKPPVRKSPPKRATSDKPPTPERKAVDSDCKPTFKGTKASRAQVKAALTEAAGRTYWPTSAPSIKVPLNLVKATAWQESGWQSNIIACDGGVGVMQIQPGTDKTVNDRFGQNYDINDYRDNATLGANYLAWLIKYFGDAYFESDYSIATADCASHKDLCLLNVVIAAYNFGFGKVDLGTHMVIPNPGYVDNVRSLMTNCACLKF